jgi:hypothetical protein
MIGSTEREKAAERRAPSLSSLGDITGDLLRNAINLVRDEMRMATAEVMQKISKAGKSSTLFTAGGFILYAGLLYVLASAVIWLSKVIQAGWAALIIGVLALIVGGVLLIVGKRRLSADLLPRETIHTVKEDTKWMRNQLT